MKVLRTVDELREALRVERVAERRIGFVPTMGALHLGHLSLIQKARASCDVVVLSIFVNPLQFGPNEDLAAYPRPEARDLDLAREEKVDFAFLPSVEELYGSGRATDIEVGPIGDVLEGAERPGHFSGVATVVAKLLNIVQPEASFFGQKDAQQLAVIRQMVLDLSFPTTIEVGSTVRESDGLALSSRNAYLDPAGRRSATALFRSLQAGRRTWEQGEGPQAVEEKMLEVLGADPGVSPGYARVVDPETFGAPDQAGEVLLVVAARVGTTRLIDNILCTRATEVEGTKER